MPLKRMNIKNENFQININDETAFLEMKRSEIKTKSEVELLLLKREDLNLTSMSYELTEDALKLNFTFPKYKIMFSELQAESEINKLKAAINIQHLEKFIGSGLNFFIHPDNLIFNYNMEPSLLYRGIDGEMPPKTISTSEFLEEYKAIVINIFDSKTNYENILNSSLDRAKNSKFNQMIMSATSTNELTDKLLSILQEQSETERTTKKSISKRKYRVMQQLTIWISVLAVLLAIPLGYLLTSELPFQQKMLEADTAFLERNYEKVIQGLEGIKSEDLRNTERYELAYSYVQGKSLSDTQKENIKNNINLKANQDYLNYWIENGRGNLDKALDLAKKVQDPDLILYGYVQKIESIKKNPNLSGTKRESQLSKYQQEYDKYKKKYSTKKTDKSSENE